MHLHIPASAVNKSSRLMEFLISLTDFPLDNCVVCAGNIFIRCVRYVQQQACEVKTWICGRGESLTFTEKLK
jgi:hypothetical protein